MPDRVIVITGASAGVGRATAQRFARDGWRVGVIARGGLAETLEELRTLGAKAHGVEADVADADAVEHAAAEMERALGAIDVWVNNAMTTVFASVDDMTAEEFARVTAVTYLGAVHGTMAALRRMRPRKRGHIIHVGSALAYRGIPLQSAYCGAKHALVGFTESLRSELLHDKIPVHVSMVHLPAVNTPQFDWARSHRAYTPKPATKVVYQPEAAATAIARCVAHPKREYWLSLMTAQTILGGMSAPGWLDRILARTTVEGQETRRALPAERIDNLMRPAPTRHEARGSFGAGARTKGLIISGAAGRWLPIGVGALACAAIGALLGAALARRLTRSAG
ncbi:MAG TPA: SDR family oxidoreductase [Vitreimonas sp.]|uniref:SDR family oxidoreductase n=1 Tax=Vitreimonas sp. TaxID=3069702 RepID=UPI002D4A8FB8|nr:SDR family oxidoreductase [Vitreimonas sp.]HYD89608.1 SDR family oxidoreductase [Vitreimonas sp.]